MGRAALVRVALVHDDLTQRGGAERVVVSLARLFPEAPIFTTVYDPAGTFPEFQDRDVRTTFLQRLPHRGAAARALLPLYPAAVATIAPRGFDVILSSSSRFAHGVNAGRTPHVTYCYNPPRFIYQRDDYFGAGSPVPGWGGHLLGPVLGALARWDARAAQRPDRYIAISNAVAQRVAAVYGRKAEVIYPPVNLDRFQSIAGAADDKGYYLIVSRLLPYKKVHVAVAACRARGSAVVVVGDGPARSLVEAQAGPDAKLLGTVDDATLLDLLAGCRAVIHPGEEDFGLMPLEANAAGKPVITVGRAGALETVVDGETGILFADQTVEGLVEAMDRAEATRWDRQRLSAHAEHFAEPRFHRQIVEVLERVSPKP